MNSSTSDAELGRTLRAKASALGYSPDALLGLAEAAAHRQRWSIMPNFGPFPHVAAVETIDSGHLENWPEWTAKLISPGCRIEHLIWPNTTSTTRLVSPRGLVLAAFIEDPELTNK